MATLFISDLHLDDRRPAATRMFLEFLKNEARGAEALYILGDLFEYWLGDDAPTMTGRKVATALAALASHGVPCYFMHGNRDFLISGDYAGTAGLQLLDEEVVVDLYGRPTLLLHGDALCTDDVAYQQVRAKVRDPQWQREFLRKPPAERARLAGEARDLSDAHKMETSMDIMDVNREAVLDAFRRTDVRHMIHGHTHRPAVHRYDLEGGRAERIVLGDWYDQGSVLRVTPAGAELSVLAD